MSLVLKGKAIFQVLPFACIKIQIPGMSRQADYAASFPCFHLVSSQTFLKENLQL